MIKLEQYKDKLVAYEDSYILELHEALEKVINNKIKARDIDSIEVECKKIDNRICVKVFFEYELVDTLHVKDVRSIKEFNENIRIVLKYIENNLSTDYFD